MAAIPDLTDDNFKEELASEEPVLADFWATWCAPCRAIAPLVEEVARKYEGRLKVVKVDVDQNPLLASKYDIRGIPTLMLFRESRPVDQLVGAVPRTELEAAVERALEV